MDNNENEEEDEEEEDFICAYVQAYNATVLMWRSEATFGS